ncbi:hypothetical protein COCVIDRAFT_103466 [Bipolaris victoriae FI3]|uniref:Uncharacterized protein n=1 Tax=Bipolaris victoriae (strain FI3) TaxID=930091 RepID=W7EI24_BIPV3|nr:hypothetical protein COCVIDRAFT_103466 [Bipolaris victoriae FI3]
MSFESACDGVDGQSWRLLSSAIPINFHRPDSTSLIDLKSLRRMDECAFAGYFSSR